MQLPENPLVVVQQKGLIFAFRKSDYEPTDIGILSAAVKVYKEKLKEKKRQESIEKTETEQK